MGTGTAMGVAIFFILFIVGIVLLIAILYLLNLQNTLKAAQPQNRKMPPANVWLLLIPIFNIYWSFVVAKAMTETIQAEYASKGQVLDNPKPTFSVGQTMAILGVVSLILSLINYKSTIATYSAIGSGDMMSASVASSQGNTFVGSIASLVSLVSFILWIVYWVQTAKYKNQMKSLPNAKTGSEIFGQF